MPHLDGLKASLMSIEKRGIPQSLRIVVAGVHDRLRAAAGMPSAYLPIVGPYGSLAFMQLDDFETVCGRVGICCWLF